MHTEAANDPATLNIAMWSGPRNISTAMMRSWENRGDCQVVDEPFYAFYLARSGLDHPGRKAVLRAQPTQWQQVVDSLFGPSPSPQPLRYFKMMTHHLLPEVERDWFAHCQHLFLIRNPRAVVASYVKSRADISSADIGIHQQAAILREVTALRGNPPLIIDADDFLQQPQAYLQRICERLSVGFSERMLRWPAGPRSSDGVWAPYWYESVYRSTGFGWPSPEPTQLSEAHEAIARECAAAYQAMYQQRLQL